MRSSLRLGLTALILAAAPVAAHAQAGCPSGYTQSPLPGGGFSCTPIAASAPEIGATSSIGGVAVLLGGALMLRGRKRLTGASVAA